MVLGAWDDACIEVGCDEGWHLGWVVAIFFFPVLGLVYVHELKAAIDICMGSRAESWKVFSSACSVFSSASAVGNAQLMDIQL